MSAMSTSMPSLFCMKVLPTDRSGNLQGLGAGMSWWSPCWRCAVYWPKRCSAQSWRPKSRCRRRARLARLATCQRLSPQCTATKRRPQRARLALGLKLWHQHSLNNCWSLRLPPGAATSNHPLGFMLSHQQFQFYDIMIRVHKSRWHHDTDHALIAITYDYAV